MSTKRERLDRVVAFRVGESRDRVLEAAAREEGIAKGTWIRRAVDAVVAADEIERALEPKEEDDGRSEPAAARGD